jgi:hypothetical protein
VGWDSFDLTLILCILVRQLESLPKLTSVPLYFLTTCDDDDDDSFGLNSWTGTLQGSMVQNYISAENIFG